MSACPILTTERLVMRPFREDDLDRYTEILRAEPVRTALHLPAGVGREHAWGQMAAWLGQWELRGTGQWALEDRETGLLVGRAGLHRPERHDWPGVEVGWMLHPDHWGRGFATEAGAAAVRYAFDELEVAELFSLILPANERSQQVARRLDFELRDERIISHFPDAPHGIWHLPRPA